LENSALWEKMASLNYTLRYLGYISQENISQGDKLCGLCGLPCKRCNRTLGPKNHYERVEIKGDEIGR
jgi:hypothetical protein